MKKTAILLVCTAFLAAALVACRRDAGTPAYVPHETENTGTPAYVEPAMEGTTIAEGTSELSTETALQAPESETAARTEIAAPFSTGTTARAAATSTTKPAAAAQIVPTAATMATAPHTSATTRTTTPTTQSTTTTRVTTTTTRSTTTTTARPTTTTTTAAAPTTTTKAASDYEAMGQTTYQAKVIEALNALRTGRGLAPMALSEELMASTLAQAQKMAAAGKSFHTEGFPPGFESVANVPYDFPAQLLGEMLANHVQNFLQDGYSNVGIAVVRSGNTLYAVMQGN